MLLEWIIKRNDKNPTAHAEVAHISRERLSLCCCSMYLHVQYQLFVCSHQCSDLICTTLLSPPFHQHWHWISKPKLSPLLLEISCFYLYLFFFFFLPFSLQDVIPAIWFQKLQAKEETTPLQNPVRSPLASELFSQQCSIKGSLCPGRDKGTSLIKLASPPLGRYNVR